MGHYMPSGLGVPHAPSQMFLRLCGNVHICKIGTVQKFQVDIFCHSKDVKISKFPSNVAFSVEQINFFQTLMSHVS